jgi:pimeloyl-ACP methyl ester carboxylesterase
VRPAPRHHLRRQAAGAGVGGKPLHHPRGHRAADAGGSIPGNSTIRNATPIRRAHPHFVENDRRPADEWNLDTFADDVVRLCDALGIVKPVVLGQSYGGFVAQRYLARHPAHPGRVILSSTSHHFGLDRKLAMFERLGGAAARDAARAFWLDPTAATWADYERLCRPHYNTLPAADPQAKARTIAVDEILFHTARHEMPAMNLLPGLQQVQCPVLVMHGDADPVTPIADAEEIVAALPARWRRFQRFSNVGHGAWRDDPDAALDCIRRFVTED